MKRILILRNTYNVLIYNDISRFFPSVIHEIGDKCIFVRKKWNSEQFYFRLLGTFL